MITIDKKFLVSGGAVLLIGFVFQPLRLIAFVISGGLVGLFYGAHNHEIWPTWVLVKEKPKGFVMEPKQYEKAHFY